VAAHRVTSTSSSEPRSARAGRLLALIGGLLLLAVGIKHLIGAADRFEFVFGGFSIASSGLAIGAYQRRGRAAAAEAFLAALLPFAVDMLSAFTDARRSLAHVGPLLLAAASVLSLAAGLLLAFKTDKRLASSSVEGLHVPRIVPASFLPPNPMLVVRGSCSCGWRGVRRRRRSDAVEDLSRHVDSLRSDGGKDR
jgi:hypothetical protein